MTSNTDTRLFYTAPATNWNEALPVGNSRLGAMVFGDPVTEHLQLNEETLWDGYRRDCHNPRAAEALPEVRRLLFAGENAAAEALATEALLGTPSRIKSYQTLGDLFLTFSKPGFCGDYWRDLDLSTAITTTMFRTEFGVTVRREVFASHPHNVLVVRIVAETGVLPNLTVRLSRGEYPQTHKPPHSWDAQYAPNQIVTSHADRSGLRLVGKVVTDESRPEKGTRFAAHVKITAESGTIRPDGDNQIVIKNATTVTLILAAATDYRGGDPETLCAETLSVLPDFDTLRAEHIADHARLFHRVQLNLGTCDAANLPTNERLARVRSGESDNALAALYFHYGRYLLIASSRPGSLPANLQGIWNPFFDAPWQSDFHVNINLQMNYWHAETANLAECHEPLFDFLETLIAPGRETARRYYGCRGAMMHHVTDVWGFTVPADFIGGIWVMGLAWCVSHVWERFRFGGDTVFLRERGYPLLREAARFLADFLVESPSGTLVTCPSHSPENRFRKADGTESLFGVGATMDLMIVRELFENTVAAASV